MSDSWLKEKAKDFVVGSTGLADAVFNTHTAAMADAYFETDTDEELLKRVNSNIKAEDEGGRDKAWAQTEDDIARGAKGIASGLAFGGATVLILGVAIATLIIHKKAS
jgi:hypothetical protein